MPPRFAIGMPIFHLNGRQFRRRNDFVNGYFDSNATTPLFPAARAALLAGLNAHWHNPSSLYREAGAAKRRLEEAREELASRLGVEEERRVVFTSGATESNNIVIAHVAAAQGGTVICSAVEHPSVLAPARRAFAAKPTLAPVHANGRVDMEELAKLIRAQRPALISVMAANNETGALQPWEAIARLAQEEGVPFHCDAAQWVGKMPAGNLGICDWVTGSAHKFGGPKGVGFLVVPESVERLSGSQTGGPQESSLRAGTENLPGIAAMLAALAQTESMSPTGSGRDGFEARVLAAIPGTKVAGGEPRLWNTSMLVMPAHGNLKWVTRLSHLGFQASTGSACSSGKENPSHVMEAIGLSYEEMGRVLRFSGGWETTDADWDGLAAALESVWRELNEPTAKGGTRPRIQL